MKSLILSLLCLLMASNCYAEVPADYANRLADAIYKAEGGTKTRHPYGILVKYKHTTPRQACLNTIRSNWNKWEKDGKRGDYIEALGRVYCPIGASNDPTGLNKHWVSNVRYWFNK